MKRLLPFILLSAIWLTGCNGDNNSSGGDITSESTTVTTTTDISTTSANSGTEAAISSTTRTEQVSQQCWPVIHSTTSIPMRMKLKYIL